MNVWRCFAHHLIVSRLPAPAMTIGGCGSWSGRGQMFT